MSIRSLSRLSMLFALALGLSVARPVVHAAPDDKPDAPAADEPSAQDLADELLKIDQSIGGKSPDYAKASGEYAAFLPKLAKAKIDQAKKDKIESDAQYNYACCLSRTGKKDEAIKALERAIKCGFSDFDHIGQDNDLDAIRNEDAFKKVVDEGRKHAADNNPARKATEDALKQKPLYAFDLDVKTTDGKKLKLADLKGKVVIIDFWGTWCPPCRKEIPEFVKLYDKLKEKGVEIVGVALEHTKDQDQAEKGVKAFAEKNSIKYPLACADHENEAVKTVVGRTKAVPTTVFIDKDGCVRAEFVGGRDYATLEATTMVLLDAMPGTGVPGDKADATKKD